MDRQLLSFAQVRLHQHRRGGAPESEGAGQGCSGKTVLDTCTVVLFGLWLILNKHFIAEPARSTSLPGFVSDTIYEMSTKMRGQFRCDSECSPYNRSATIQHVVQACPVVILLPRQLTSAYVNALTCRKSRVNEIFQSYGTFWAHK